MKIFLDKSLSKKSVASNTFFEAFLETVFPKKNNFGKNSNIERPVSIVEAVNPLVLFEDGVMRQNEDNKGQFLKVCQNTMYSKMTTPHSEQSIDFPIDAIVKEPPEVRIHNRKAFKTALGFQIGSMLNDASMISIKSSVNN